MREDVLNHQDKLFIREGCLGTLANMAYFFCLNVSICHFWIFT